MTLRFHNTLTRQLEDFEPGVPDEVRMYTCGPTVYARAHIGNFRAFVWEDLLRRYLKFRGYRVTQVMNLTDVDDRTINSASEKGVGLDEVTGPVIRQFFEDWATLGLEPVEHNPRATEYVDHMIALVRKLEAKGYTYEADGSVYFAIARLPDYGKLVNLDLESLRPSGRVTGDEEYDKDDPRDFVLWKGRQPENEELGLATWDSPWGRGRPGWHLECSAMAMALLGETLDIHTGGVDNIFPHHTNEIAQSEAATGAPFARYWLHAAHLLVDGGKMSKSLGNFYTLPDLLDRGFRASAIRYLLASGHYRSQLNFTFEGVRDAERALERLETFRRRLEELLASGKLVEGRGELAGKAAEARAAFVAAMDDDLGVSDALAAVFTLVREANQKLDAGAGTGLGDVEASLGLLRDYETVFGVLDLRARETADVSDEMASWVESRIEAREEARRSRDFGLADRIRDEIEARGFTLEDGPEGTRWKMRESAAT